MKQSWANFNTSLGPSSNTQKTNLGPEFNFTITHIYML